MFRFTQEPSSGSHNTDNPHIDKHSGTIPVILARHWFWLPDDGSCVREPKHMPP